MLILTYQREFMKGYIQREKQEIPDYAFYDVYTKDMPLFLNLLTFFLLMAMLDKAFKRYYSVIEILSAIKKYQKLSPSENKILKVIQIRKEVKELPVFR